MLHWQLSFKKVCTRLILYHKAKLRKKEINQKYEHIEKYKLRISQ